MAIWKTATESNTKRGVCKVCGEAADDPRATLCSEHRGNSKGNAESVKPSSGATTAPAPTGATAGKWNDFSAKLLVVLTTFLGMMIVRGAKVYDPDDDLADRFAMTDKEAKSIAKPFSRFVSKTTFSAKHGAAITGNDDLIDAAISGWEYSRRFNKEATQLRELAARRDSSNAQTHRTPAQPYTPPAQAVPTEESETENGETIGQNEGPRAVVGGQHAGYDVRGYAPFG